MIRMPRGPRLTLNTRDIRRTLYLNVARESLRSPAFMHPQCRCSVVASCNVHQCCIGASWLALTGCSCIRHMYLSTQIGIHSKESMRRGIRLSGNSHLMIFNISNQEERTKIEVVVVSYWFAKLFAIPIDKHPCQPIFQLQDYLMAELHSYNNHQ